MARKKAAADPKKPKKKASIESYNAEAAARNAIRKAFSRSPLVIHMTREVNFRKVPQYTKSGERHKIDAAEHLCAHCGEWKRGKVAIDHIIPVVDPDVGFVDFNTYFTRTFCSKENLQKLCQECHDKKTAAENIIRKLRDALRDLVILEAETDLDKLRKGLRKWPPGRLKRLPYDTGFLERLDALKQKVKPAPREKAKKRSGAKAKSGKLQVA